MFDNNEVSVTRVLASACLPFLSQAVKIDGEYFWDGGYMRNPALFPLIYNCESRDIIVIHINPTERLEIPRTAPEIMSRINEISFNSSLLREMQAIAFVTKLIDDGKLIDKNLKRLLVHSIEDRRCNAGSRRQQQAQCGLGIPDALTSDRSEASGPVA